MDHQPDTGEADMASALPIHPHTGLRAIYVSERTGRAYWPVLGAEDAPPPTITPPPTVAPPAPADPGFPANTPLEQMNGEQREAYWKHYARRNEDRLKPFKDWTPEKLAELQDKAKRHDDLELELGTTADKAAAKAAEEAQAAARGQYQPALITARLDAAAARAGVAEDDLAKAVEFIDTNKFLTADGQVDADKVKAFVSTITPATGTPQPQQPKGPTSGGTGRRGGAPTAGGSVAAGADLWAQKHPQKAS